MALFKSSPKRLIKRLIALRDELERARDEQRVVEEQLLTVADQDDDDRIRMLVSENRFEEKRWRTGHRHRQLIERNLAAARSRVAELEARDRELVDELANAP